MYYVVVTDRLDKEALDEIYGKLSFLDGLTEIRVTNWHDYYFEFDAYISMRYPDECMGRCHANYIATHAPFEHVIVVNSETQTYYCINPDANVERG